mgnify:CR=1 FL=1|tara:strand:+ start:2646 stop:3092 length:447 start_codon:yes stop_codon:yes gene_type:complete
MATKMTNFHEFYDLAHGEIARVTKLREDAQETAIGKMAMVHMWDLTSGGAERSVRMKECVCYYETLDLFLAQKLRLWGQIKNEMLDANMLEKLQETMTDYLDACWKYMGMERLAEDTETSKAEFDMFKRLCAYFPIKPKKKTRRGGKK